MTLLKPKKANEVLKDEVNKLESRKQETINEIQKKTIAFQETNDHIQEAEAKLWKNHQAFIDGITKQIKELEAEVKELERRKEEAEKPYLDLIAKAKDMMKQAEEKMHKADEYTEDQKDLIHEVEIQIADQIEALKARLDDVTEREYMLENNEKYAVTRRQLADALFAKAEKEYKETTESLDKREKDLVERERAVRDKENGLEALSETLKKKQEEIIKDRAHLQSQQLAFQAAKQ